MNVEIGGVRRSPDPPRILCRRREAGKEEVSSVLISLSRGPENEQMNVLVCLELRRKSWSGDRNSEVVNI